MIHTTYGSPPMSSCPWHLSQLLSSLYVPQLHIFSSFLNFAFISLHLNPFFSFSFFLFVVLFLHLSLLLSCFASCLSAVISRNLSKIPQLQSWRTLRLSSSLPLLFSPSSPLPDVTLPLSPFPWSSSAIALTFCSSGGNHSIKHTGFLSLPLLLSIFSGS